MFKPSYVVVTSVLFVLVILAFARHAFERFIPPVATNRLAGYSQQFLATAGHEPIDWHLIDEKPFRQAFLSGKPVLLVVGFSTGKSNQEFGSSAFEDVDIAQFVARNFFCIRIDGYEHPEWLNAFLPVTRMSTGMKPGFQAWVLNADGRVVTNVSRLWSTYPLDAAALLSTLAGVRDAYNALAKDSHGQAMPVDLQESDLTLLNRTSDTAIPDFHAYNSLLATATDPINGGFPQDGFQRLYPNAWRYLTLTGDAMLWRASVAPLLCSRLVDLQDGGFFRTGLDPEVSHVEFDKNTCQNAELMLNLAMEGQLQDEPFYTLLAKSTFDWLARSVNLRSLVGAAQQDDETPQGRSPRLSFPVWRLSECLSGSDRDWARDELGLDPSRNQQMTPYLKSSSTLLFSSPIYERVMNELRATTTALPEWSDPGYLSVNGHVAACMLQAARLWHDADRQAKAVRLAAQVDTFRDGYELEHGIIDRKNRRGCLSDFLAYADEKLQTYLATGDTATLATGQFFLLEALRLFNSRRPGQLNMTRTVAEMGGFESLDVPEVADNLFESCSAQAIRLMLDYGRLASDTAVGQKLLHQSRLAVKSLEGAESAGGPLAGGYYCAAAEVADGTYAMAVGPYASALASDLYRSVPTRFVAPAVGPVRRDMQVRKPGIYLVGPTVRGPFTVDEAAALLPKALNIGGG